MLNDTSNERMRQPPKAILLDLDDTIISYDAGAAECWEQVCDRYAADVGLASPTLLAAINTYRTWFWSDPERHRQGRLDLMGARRRSVGGAMASLDLSPSDPHVASCIGSISRDFMACRDRALTIFPDSIPAIDALLSRGTALALLTNGESHLQRAKIDRFGLASRFEHIFIEEECGYGKPDERIFHDAMNTLGVAADATWMVGDNISWEVEGAQAQGIAGIWIDRYNIGLPPETNASPDRIITSLAELL